MLIAAGLGDTGLASALLDHEADARRRREYTPRVPDHNLLSQVNSCTRTGTAGYQAVTHTLKDPNLSK